MTTLRNRAMALTVAYTIAATVPAAADSGYGAPSTLYPALWQGWYAGIHLGYGEAGPADGFVGGAQVGYNWQKGQIVYGLEADITWSDVGFSEGVGVCLDSDCASVRVRGSIDWMATVRGRLGLLLQPGLLAYATAGFGLVSGSVSASISGFGLSERFSLDDTESDFVYGIGVEARLSPGTTLRVEYLGFDDSDLDVIRAAVSFRLGY